MRTSDYTKAATRADISGSNELFVKTTIDELVKDTGLPAVGKILIAEGIADRKTLRKMERKGIITCLPIANGSSVFNGYYTEDALPKSVREWRESQDGTAEREGTGLGEGVSGGLRTAEEGQEQSGA